jgi:hypothetical protein
MATQKHLNRECEGGLMFEGQCSPHTFLINFKVSACHMFVLRVHILAAIYAGSLPLQRIEKHWPPLLFPSLEQPIPAVT